MSKNKSTSNNKNPNKNQTPSYVPDFACSGMTFIIAFHKSPPRVAMIPMKMISDVPFPIPYSVILSPSHITKALPPVSTITINIIVNTSLTFPVPNMPDMLDFQLTTIPIPCTIANNTDR